MRIQQTRWRKRLAFTATELLVATSLATSVGVSQYTQVMSTVHQTTCKENLRRVGLELIGEAISAGYPVASLYPTNAVTGPDSICVVVAGVPKSMWVCPAMPQALQAKGLTFLYNSSLSGKPWGSLPNPSTEWVLIEINCLLKGPGAPTAHPGGFNILYADGHVATTRTVPMNLSRYQKSLGQLLRKLDLEDWFTLDEALCSLPSELEAGPAANTAAMGLVASPEDEVEPPYRWN